MPKLSTEGRLVKIETGLEYLKDQVDEIKGLLKNYSEWESQKYDSFETKFANKWVEKVSIALASGIVLTVLTYIIMNVR